MQSNITLISSYRLYVLYGLFIYLFSAFSEVINKYFRYEIFRLYELPEMKQIEHGMNDEYSCDFVSFQVMHFVIYVADEELSTALKELTEKQRNAILLRFFQGMNDREISKLYHVSRSAINSRRDRGLRKLQKLLNERE
ncbi:sigma-70 family RNA polymerase sigma factor [Extibacter muris]|uniref:Sigma-70 family RNA polymerase sigma factor n=1 Tax=Extibacter muris TaxID=1796622 RepID=A0A4R4FFW2_9FIRM|nr:sigma-70 family RNA polymerase sigma factor [Extibacter muris]